MGLKDIEACKDAFAIHSISLALNINGALVHRDFVTTRPSDKYDSNASLRHPLSWKVLQRRVAINIRKDLKYFCAFNLMKI